MSVNHESPTVTFYFGDDEYEFGPQFITTMLPRLGDRVTVGDSDAGREEMKYRTGIVTDVNWTFTFHREHKARKERWVAVSLREVNDD